MFYVLKRNIVLMRSFILCMNLTLSKWSSEGDAILQNALF